MIAVSPACRAALLRDPVRIRPRAYFDRLVQSYYIPNAISAHGRIEITEYVTDWGQTQQRLPPFLGDATISDLVLTVDNSDGKFTSRSQGGFFPDGAASYYGAVIQIEQDVLLPDGAYESIPVYSGLIQYVLPVVGAVEIKTAGIVGILDQSITPEDVALQPWDTTGPTRFLDHVDALIASTPFGVGTCYDTSDDGARQLNLGLSAGGWTLAGGLAPHGNIGAAVRELARSALATVVDSEDGLLRFVPLCLPREWGAAYVRTDINLAEMMQEPLAMNFSLDEGVQSMTTEITVRYAGGTTVAYRATADESAIGRRVIPPIRMEFCRLDYQAGWAARLIYEFYKGFPLTVAFSAPAVGLIAQVGDIVNVKDTITETQRTGIVVGKSWSNPGMVSLAVRINPAHSDIFEADQATWGTDSWGADVL